MKQDHRCPYNDRVTCKAKDRDCKQCPYSGDIGILPLYFQGKPVEKVP